MSKIVPILQATTTAAITCASCKAACCSLEVLLMAGDDIPDALVTVDRWGGHVMSRLDDGWCAALDRATYRCRIYERRPLVCREFEMGGYECREQRKSVEGT